MSDVDRIVAIRKLFISKMEKMPADMPHEERIEKAKLALDKVLGPIWRDEIEDVDLDPIGDKQTNSLEPFYDKLRKALQDEGHHGGDTPCAPEDASELNKRKDKDSIIGRIMAFIHG